MKRTAYPPLFEAFWRAYPRRVKKRLAYASWCKAVEQITESSGSTSEDAGIWLIERAKSYACSDDAKEIRFCPHASTWLNQERYDDDDDGWSHASVEPDKPSPTDFVAKLRKRANEDE
jgi:hypothetical protein